MATAVKSGKTIISVIKTKQKEQRLAEQKFSLRMLFFAAVKLQSILSFGTSIVLINIFRPCDEVMTNSFFFPVSIKFATSHES
jgi:hypothetical protein